MHQALTHAAARMTRLPHASFQAFLRHRRERHAILTLQALSDAELKDMGVPRCAIPELVRAR